MMHVEDRAGFPTVIVLNIKHFALRDALIRKTDHETNAFVTPARFYKPMMKKLIGFIQKK